ncbi:MAG: tail fiber domain-containing protein [Parafilimonas sp.]
MKKQLLRVSAVALVVLTSLCTKTNAQTWKLVGNAGIDTTKNFIGTTDQNALIFKTNTLERMRIQAGGKIGMGTKTPTAKLNVVSSDIVSLTTPGMLMLGNVKGSNMALDNNVIQSRYNGTASSLYLNYYGGTTYLGASAQVSVSSLGNFTAYKPVGINGSYNAAYALNVNANSSISGIVVTDPVDNYVLYSDKSGINGGIYVSKSSTATGTATIQGNASGSGIGVEGSANTSYGVYGYSSANYGVYGYNANGLGTGVYGYSPGGSGSNGVWGYCGGNGHGVYGYCANGSGVYGTSGTYYAGWFDGDVYCSGTYVGSDLKLKQNIKDVTSAMDIINQLHPKQYNFKTDDQYKLMHLPKGNHYGLIAQDVEKILPNIVRESKFEAPDLDAAMQPSAKEGGSTQASLSSKAKPDAVDFKALNYTELIPIIIKGMQEQQAVIEKQQQQINQLQQLIQNQNSSVTSNASDAKIATATGAYLLQNAPNPFVQNTSVKCYVPTSVQQAQLVVYNLSGQLIKSYSLTSGMNTVTINAGTLSSGQYTYSLVADGKKVDSKSMIMTK